MEQLTTLDPLTIVLILLVIAGIWAVVELALFLRRTRKSVADVTDSLNQTIVEFQPTVAKLDGIVDELGSSSKQLEPILEKASTTVDLVNVNLVRTESVLADVNTATNTAANLTSTASAAAGNAANAVAGVVNKVAGKVSGKVGGSKLEAASAGEPARLVEAETPVVEQVKGDAGYFTYPSAGEPAGQATPAVEVPVTETPAEEAPVETVVETTDLFDQTVAAAQAAAENAEE